MPPSPKPARVVKWRGHWYFFYRDAAGRRQRVPCKNLGCHNDAQRNQQVKILREREHHDTSLRLRLGPQLDYSRPIGEAVTMFITHSDERTDVEPATQREVHKALDHFTAWLADNRPTLTTGNIDGPTLNAFLNSLRVSAATTNKYRRNLKAMLRWLDTVRPRLFPEIAHLMPALRQEYVPPRDAVAFTPGKLVSMRDALDEDQRRLFVFLACTGCRVAEAHALTWDDVDLDRGRIRFSITKTGRPRILPLVNAPEGEVAPGLLKAMIKNRKKWPLPCGARHRRDHWRNMGVCNPHMLRANWVSYAASCGVPASIAAIWAGHGAAVAEKHYRMQVLERVDAESIQSAMGL